MSYIVFIIKLFIDNTGQSECLETTCKGKGMLTLASRAPFPVIPHR